MAKDEALVRLLKHIINWYVPQEHKDRNLAFDFLDAYQKADTGSMTDPRNALIDRLYEALKWAVPHCPSHGYQQMNPVVAAIRAVDEYRAEQSKSGGKAS